MLPIAMRCPCCFQEPTVSTPWGCWYIVTCDACIDLEFPQGSGETAAWAVEEWNVAVMDWICRLTMFDVYVPEGLPVEAR
jgi:hypothetical protein